MKTKVVVLCLALIFSGMQVFAPNSLRRRRRNGKRKPKNGQKNPSNLKTFTEAKQVADTDNTALKSQVSTLNGQISQKNTRIAELEDQISSMRGEPLLGAECRT